MSDDSRTPRSRSGGFLRRAETAVGVRLMNRWDAAIDRKICGRSLAKYIPSVDRDDRHGTGGTGSQSTRYAFLKRIFGTVSLTSADVILDVGCGKGRVLAFLLNEKCPARLVGVEHNEEAAAVAREWTARYQQVTILLEDAFALDYNDYTVLTLARPFLPKTFYQFIQRLEDTLTHPVTLVRWHDQGNGLFLENRPGWTLRTRGRVERLRGIRFSTSPQEYSVWVYDPAGREQAGR